MRLVNKPVTRPQHCAAVPHIGQTHPTARWVDCGVDLNGFDNHVYLSDHGVIEACRVLGLPTPDDVMKLVARIAELEQVEAYAETLEAELGRMQERLSAFETVLSGEQVSA